MATILAIDDEPDFLEQVKVVLENEGHQVETAFDGLAGLEKARRVKPTLILLDIMMPGMDGFEVLRRLTREAGTSTIPVVMLTAKGGTESVFKAQGLSVTDYLLKPFSVDELLTVIRRFVL
ncbi:MAG: response regulator [Candidatus Omnitrophica bacterium]|nr:response regulator [Candidatus Omnitrophota bacterium]